MRVSVLLPVFNAESTLPAAVESILRQDFADFELLLIDDGSRDGSAEIIRAFARRDERINFVGGIRGLEGLARPVDEGRYRVAFSLFPTRMTELMAVADAGEVMPPKSTWFEPKLADGLVSHVLD